MMERFGIYHSLKCIHGHIVKPVQQDVKNWRSVQCTEAGIEGQEVRINLFFDTKFCFTLQKAKHNFPVPKKYYTKLYDLYLSNR
jgi:acetate kinase